MKLNDISVELARSDRGSGLIYFVLMGCAAYMVANLLFTAGRLQERAPTVAVWLNPPMTNPTVLVALPGAGRTNTPQRAVHPAGASVSKPVDSVRPS